MLGFPIRKYWSQRSLGSSSNHIAACNVLHRLTAPRDPPCALTSLTCKIMEPFCRQSENRSSSADHDNFKHWFVCFCLCSCQGTNVLHRRSCDLFCCATTLRSSCVLQALANLLRFASTFRLSCEKRSVSTNYFTEDLSALGSSLGCWLRCEDQKTRTWAF